MCMGSRLSPRRGLNTIRRAPTGAVRRWATNRGAPTGAVRDMGNNPASAYGSPPVDAVHPVGAYGSGPAVGGQPRGGSGKRSLGWVASRGRPTGAVRGLRVTWARLPEAIRGLLVVLWGLREAVRSRCACARRDLADAGRSRASDPSICFLKTTRPALLTITSRCCQNGTGSVMARPPPPRGGRVVGCEGGEGENSARAVWCDITPRRWRAPPARCIAAP